MNKPMTNNELLEFLKKEIEEGKGNEKFKIFFPTSDMYGHNVGLSIEDGKIVLR